MDTPLLIAFDADIPGRDAALRLSKFLHARGITAPILPLPAGINDLNQWMQTAPPQWQHTFTTAARAALTPSRRRIPARR
jgi:hypothetical protein